MEIHIHKISKKLRNLREDRHFTQAELAEFLGVSRQSIIALERGRCLPSLPLALGFSEIFKMPFESIFGDDEFFQSNIKERKETVPMTYDLMPLSPLHEVSSLHEAIDKLFESNHPAAPQSIMPAVSVYEKASNIIIKADVPGIKDEDLNIEVGDDSVTLQGERKIEDETKEDNYFRKEVSYGSFSRIIALPSLVDKNKAEAELKDGTLVITLKKKAKVLPKVTKIKVKKA